MSEKEMIAKIGNKNVYKIIKNIVKEYLEDKIHPTRNEVERRTLIKRILTSMMKELKILETNSTTEILDKVNEYLKSYKIDAFYIVENKVCPRKEV